jgi:hypothetical protein
MLLLVGALLGQLADDFLSEACGLSEHLVESLEHLLQVLGTY